MASTGQKLRPLVRAATHRRWSDFRTAVASPVAITKIIVKFRATNELEARRRAYIVPHN